MGDISFLSDKSGNANKDKGSGSSPVEWSVPSDQNDFLSGAEDGGAEKKSGFFSFGKSKEKKRTKEQVEAERELVLNALNGHEKAQAVGTAPADKPSIFSFFMPRRKKSGLSIDFEADFKEDQKRRDTKIDRALGQASPLSDGMINIPIDPPIREKDKPSPGVSDDIASYRTTWFDRLIDRWLKKQAVKEIKEEMQETGTGNEAPLPDPAMPFEAGAEKGAALAGEAKAEKTKQPAVEKKKNGKDLEDSDVLETNLLEGESISFFDWRKNMTILGVFAMMSAIIVGMGYAGLVIYGDEQAKDALAIENRINGIKAGIAEAQEGTEELAPLEKKIKLAAALLSKHIYWTKFFNFLEKYTITNVYYGSFAGDSGGKYKIGARAKSFNDLTEQLKVFKDEDGYVRQVSITGGKLTTSGKDNSSGVDFGLDITFDQSVFYK